MKNTLIATALAISAIASDSTLVAQDYNVTRDIMNLEIAVGVHGGSQNEPFYRSSPSSFATLIETVSINAADAKIRQFGTLHVPAFELPTTTLQATQIVTLPPIFPNPPTPPTAITGELTFGFSVPETVFAFDTGFQKITWDESGYIFDAPIISFSIPVSFAMSLSTGGETYLSTHNTFIEFRILTSGALDVSDYPANIGVSPLFSISPVATEIYSFTAENGFVGAISVIVIPEPNTMALFSTGLAVLAFVRRSKSRR